MSEYTLFEETREYPNGTITITILPDSDIESPDKCGDCEPTFFLASSGQQLSNELELEFVNPKAAYAAMVTGEVYDPGNDTWYYGFSMYEHSGRALAFCNSPRARNFPDQQWDVTPLVGWIKITKKLREDWGVRGDAELAESNAQSCLDEWESYLNGNGCGYIVTVTDLEGKEIEEDSCWGYYFMDDAVTDAKAAAEHYARKFWKELGTTQPEENSND